MSAVPQLATRWPREHYDRAVEAGVFDDACVELLDGEIVETMSQSGPHAAASCWLRNHLTRVVGPGRWLVGGHEPIALSAWSEPEPDVWLAHTADVNANQHPPVRAMVLVVEVSWSSQYQDRVRKAPALRRGGVPEYWIVDLQRNVVDVHRSPIGNRYAVAETARRGDHLTVPEAGLVVEATELLGPDA